MPSPGFNQFPAGVPRIGPFPLEAYNALNARRYLGKAPHRQPTYPHQTAKSPYTLVSTAIAAIVTVFLLALTPNSYGVSRDAHAASSHSDRARSVRSGLAAHEWQARHLRGYLRGHSVHAAQMARIFTAIRRVESCGNDYKVGDNGRSRGPYQIQRGYWRDACRSAGLHLNYDRLVWDRRSSEAVMLAYWRLQGARTTEQMARIHNGGPDGMNNPATREYYQRVQSQMRQL